ncbi:hypothetical protein N3K66_000021 [Trichothecium roseum]|uniref:Uncharacterized protein n=1 Tax=Trichothecium roseum TaxID=47278 RepID=A0ACC0VAN4_9HYPO|nr:hypothetical protein N3K66_000021 [Trichothecium roseum]
MVPTVYFKLDHIPITASGKIDRRRLRALGAQLSAKELANFKSDVEKRAPTTEEEAVLVQIWASILGLGADDIGIDDNFVQLGGDSITAMMVVGEARKQGYELKVADVLHQPRLHQLASTSQQFVGNEGEISRAQVQGPIEQSFAQGRLWFLDQLYPNSTQYLMPYAMRLRGPLQVNALSAALCGIESRHETLRTVFASENDVNLQIVRPFQLSDLPIIDIPDEESFKDALRKEQSTPFNLTTDPGWRLTLYRLGDDHHVLSIVMHHIISDGWSASILQRELSSFYSASLRGQDPLAQISPLPIQYRDYAVWQKEQNQLDEQQRQLEYWVNQLQTSAPAEFFCDKPRPAVLSGQAEIEEIVIQGSAYSRLQEFCKEREITPFIALLSAFRATHYRLTGSKDATIGTANANRDRWQLKDMIGFFVNMQCLRIAADGESFEELVQQVQETTKASLKNQDIPFEQIVSRLKRDRDMARQPLVQVVFTLHSQRDLGQFKLEGLETEQMHLALSSRFDLEFHFSQEEGSLRGEVAFSTDLYERETVRNMLELFQQILHQGLHNPTQSISLLPFATEASLSDLHDHGLLQMPRTDYARESSIVDIFRQQTAAHPNRLAAKDDSGQMTYEQLDQNSNLIARWLKSRSYEDEKLIGVYSGRTCQTIAAFLGILKANMAYVPLDTRSPVGRVETIVSAIQGQRTILLGPGIQPPALLSEDVEFVSISDILNNGYSSQDLEFSVTSNTPSPTSLAYVMFTSGSTGKPKGVMIEHRGVVRLATQNNITRHFPPFHIMAHMGNIAFDISTWEIYATILNGGTLICIDNMTVLDNNALANTFLKESIQSAIITPALLKHCLIESPAMISQLHVLLCGGDKADGQDLLQAQRISKATVINAYGPTENTVISTFYSVKDDDAFVDGVPIGGAISNSGAFVVDSDLGLVPIGVVGELVVTGDGLARGYTNPSLNLDRFVSMDINGNTVRGYRTGDYVRYRPLDAQMEFLGRIDGQLKVRGQRIELGEIENVMQSHQSVQDAVVVAQQQGEQELQLAGFITILDKGDELESLDDVVDENAAEHIEVWETLFDSDKYTTVDDVKPESIGRDFTAWTSMYDGKLIEQVEMREWLDDTICTMLNGGAPGNVLEVGTGTGMMLFNLVGGLESYVGLEPTEKAIRFVNYAAKMIPGLSDKIYVQKGTATDVKRLRRLNTPNLIVINSVAQYFPSQRYLYDVVKQLVRQEGARTIFFGDMRSYALYDQFKMTKALHLQGYEASKSVLRQQMKEIGDAEQELLVDPAFFTALPELMPDFVEHVEIVPKQMQATNELSCYRYAAVLYVKQPEQDREIHHIASGDWINFDHDKLNRQSLLELLQHRLPITEILAVSNIPHSKTIGERHMLEQLKCRGEEDEGGWITSTLAEAELHESLSVIELNEIAELAGCRVDISWARQYSQRGGFDAVFHYHTPIEGTNRVLFHFPTDHSGRPTNSLCSRPLMQRMRQKTPFELLERLRSQLPSYMVPQAITVLDKMPVNENGKLDRRALAESATTLPILQKQNSQQQPMTPVERQLQEIWAQVLYMDPATIGLEDSFFQLGGDSIAAMKVVSQAHKFNINISVADIFRNPILCELARGEEGASRELIGAVPPFSLITNQVDQGSLREQISSLCGSDAEMVEDIYPCTPLQEGLMSLTAKRHGDYVMQAVFELSAHINIPDFKTAWEVVFATTEILRTRIVQHEVLGLTQVVLKEELPWVHHKNLEGYIASDTSQEMGPGDILSRFAIILPEDKNRPRCFVWTIHHALYDGWTIPRIMGLVGDCYNDIAIKRDPPRFSSFVKHILDVKHSDAESFWKSYLADAEFATYPHLPSASFEPAPDGEIELKITLNASSKTETTVSTMIRGALALLIHQYTRSADVIFGAVLSGRNAPVSDVDDIVGPTIATVPVRVKVDEKQSVVGYLQQLQQQATDMMDFEQTGLQRIAGVDENGRRACAFQTLVAIQPHEDDQEDVHQLGRWQDSEAHQGFSSTYALILQCFLGRDQVKIKASFDTRVLSEWQVQNMIRQFGTILNKLADAQGSQTISDIDSLSDEDKEALWNLNKMVPVGVQD